MCVCAYVVENLFERVSLFFVLILLFVCAENSFFWVCVSILIIFCCIHTNTGWFVSFHFISFHYISDVDHYCFACYKNVGFSSHFITCHRFEWVRPVLHEKRPADFIYIFFSLSLSRSLFLFDLFIYTVMRRRLWK